MLDWSRLHNYSNLTVGFMELDGTTSGVNSDMDVLLAETEKNMYHVYLCDVLF